MSRPGGAPLRYAILFLGIAGLSMAGVFYKLSAVPVVTIVGYRMLVATLLTVPLALLSGRLSPKQGRTRFARSDVWISALSGAFFAFDILLWATSLQFTTIASAALFVSIDPIFVALFAWAFLREAPPLLLMTGILVGLTGMVIVAGNDVHIAGRALLGDGLAVSAAVCETGYLLVGRHVRQRVDAPRYTMVVYSACTAVIWIVMLLSKASPALSARDLVLAFALAAVVTVLGHTIVSYSLGHMPAVVVAASFLAQPMLSALLALAFVHQQIPHATVLGGTIALIGIGIVAYANERRRAEGVAATPV